MNDDIVRGVEAMDFVSQSAEWDQRRSFQMRDVPFVRFADIEHENVLVLIEKYA